MIDPIEQSLANHLAEQDKWEGDIEAVLNAVQGDFDKSVIEITNDHGMCESILDEQPNIPLDESIRMYAADEVLATHRCGDDAIDKAVREILVNP